MDNKPLAELRNIRLLYGQKIIFEDLHFKLLAGEKWFLYGNNGSGKTSFLKLLAQLQSPTSGTVQWHCQDKAELPRVNYVNASSRGLFTQLTGEENLRVINKLRVSIDQSDVIFKEFKNFNNFDKALDTRFCECSMGMKKLLTLAVGLLYPSKVILLDEPFLHLDQENQKFLSEILSNLNSTIIIASPENKSIKGFEYKCLS